MTDPVPLTFTTYDGAPAHARRAGERSAVCGVYVKIRLSSPESLVPTRPLCPPCSLILTTEKEAS